MFDNLTRKVSSALGQLGGKRTLDENNIAETLRTVRLALLEADVALSVVQTFLDRVRARAVGSEVTASLSASESFLKIVNEELIEVLGGACVQFGAPMAVVQPPPFHECRESSSRRRAEIHVLRVVEEGRKIINRVPHQMDQARRTRRATAYALKPVMSLDDGLTAFAFRLCCQFVVRIDSIDGHVWAYSAADGTEC